MTDVNTDHPYGIPYIELTENGRKISFRRECLGVVKIYRMINDEEPKMLIQQVRTPFIDTEAFPDGTRLTYSIELEQGKENKQYDLEVRL